MASSFSLFGLEINFYGLLIGSAFLLGLLLISYFSKIRGYSKDLPYDIVIIVFPLAIIGARIYYIIFSGRSWTLSEMISIQDGGLAIYGGVILAFLGLLVYSYIKKMNILKITDLIIPALLLGQAIGRWGNYFNQEAFGKLVEKASLQWFPYAVYIDRLQEWHMATFFYESLWNFAGFWIAILVYLQTKSNRFGYATSFYFIYYGVGRAIIEGFRTDSLYLGAFRVSQILSVILVIIGIALFVGVKLYEKNKISKNKKR